jgi:SAM-dependent methyltransferase
MPFPRTRQPELMDDPALAASEHRHALAGLARINRLSRSGASIWAVIAPLLPRSGPVLNILDLATGSGDVAADVAQRAAGSGFTPHLTLVDVSAEALSAAMTRASAAAIPADSIRCDAVASGIPLPAESVDVAVCSLFLHHLDEPDVVRVLSELRRVARHAVVISDLVRSRRGLFAAQLAGRLLTTSRIVRVDAVLSVRAAWTPEELLRMARQAGLKNAAVRRTFPFRMLLVWSRV